VVNVEGEHRSVARETCDHLIVHGNLQAGGTVVTEVVGGSPRGHTPFELVVLGDDGELALTGGAPRGFQSERLALSLNGETQTRASRIRRLTLLAYTPVCATISWAMSRRHPDFEHAVRLTRMIDALLAASANGRRQAEHQWPKKQT
jgi:predicted dehydrogenase